MNKIKGLIKKCFLHKESIHPIIDPVPYASICESYSGGSLAESNVLVVTNDKTLAAKGIENKFAVEYASTGVLYASSDELELKDIVHTGNKLIGPFTHVINVLRFDNPGNIHHLVSGLAKVLSPHGIICNGVIALSTVPQEAWLSTSAFLNGKYGQVMTGEVLYME